MPVQASHRPGGVSVFDMVPVAPVEAHSRGLVVGTVDGSVAEALSKRGYRVVTLCSGRGDARCVRPRPSSVVRAAADRLPFADGSFEFVALVDCLHQVVDEQIALDEAARVLRPGGTLLLQVPQAGPLGWLDARNLYHYVQHTTDRGKNPPDMAGDRWHRHYRRDELERLLSARHFRVLQTVGTGLGLGEPLDLLLLLLFRFFFPSRRRYLRARRLVCAIEAVDGRLRLGTAGRRLTLVAERTV